MKLMLTLLCRDEEDILNEMIRFHLDQGVDLIVATDNGSEDNSRLILERYARSGHLVLIDEPQHNHDQAIWVSHMAELAADKGADWIIHSDADEFWWPEHDDLKTTLSQSPLSVEAWEVNRTNFLPPAKKSNRSRKPFHQRQLIRERSSMNSMGQPLPPKICHRGEQNLFVTDGNHAVMRDGHPSRLIVIKSLKYFTSQFAVMFSSSARSAKELRHWKTTNASTKISATPGEPSTKKNFSQENLKNTIQVFDQIKVIFGNN